jgi:hypothetical protein
MNKDQLKTEAHAIVRRVIAFYIVSVVPPEQWYWTAHRLTGFLVSWRRKIQLKKKENEGLKHAFLLNSILSLLTRKHISFPVPVRAKGFELFAKPRTSGMVICSVHIPLAKVAMRFLVENGHKPKAAIAGAHRGISSVALWGSTETIPVIPTGPFVLMRAKTLLTDGDTLAVMVDGNFGQDISPNIFLLAQKLNVDVVYLLSELLPDGTIEVSFFESSVKPPLPLEAVDQQIKELQGYLQHIVQRYEKLKYAS